MKLPATDPAPVTVDVESKRRDVKATPIRRAAPTTLGGRYRLLERLGAGGTADVYRARDERLRRDVAVKVIVEWLTDDPATARRFRREAELSARLAHRNVAAVLDAGSRPREYIVMELVDGQDAAKLLKRGRPLTVAHAIDVLVQMSGALEHAHERGVIHCDIAPRNILIGRRDGLAKLVDFGLAVDRFGARHEGDVMGTPGYVAPEIVHGGRPSPQSDLYALGIVGYRLLGGTPLAGIRPDVPDSITAIVADATAASAAARPASAAELCDRLLAARTGATELRAA